MVYSYGHRNVQGLAWDKDKRLWAAEFGQDTWDELNLIEPGGNYGWPEVEGKEGESGFIDPVAQWKTSEASPSGIAYAKGSIWMAGLRGERLWRIPLSGDSAKEPYAEPQAFLEEEHGRLRTVVSAGERPPVAGHQQHGRTGHAEVRGRQGPPGGGGVARPPARHVGGSTAGVQFLRGAVRSGAQAHLGRAAAAGAEPGGSRRRRSGPGADRPHFRQGHRPGPGARRRLWAGRRPTGGERPGRRRAGPPAATHGPPAARPGSAVPGPASAVRGRPCPSRTPCSTGPAPGSP